MKEYFKVYRQTYRREAPRKILTAETELYCWIYEAHITNVTEANEETLRS